MAQHFSVILKTVAVIIGQLALSYLHKLHQI